MPKPSSNRGRLFYFTWGVLALFGCAAVSQARLQVFDRTATLDRAKKTKRFTLTRPEYARRGTIFDADGRPLAIDQDTYELNLSFDRIPRTDAFFLDLSAATGIPATDFAQLAFCGVDHKVWPESLSASQRREVQDVKTRWKADGVSLDPTGRRTYPLGEAAANVVGAMMDTSPLNGLERSQKTVLEGKNGVKIGLTDRQGNFLPMRIDPSSLPKRDGTNITTTIDSDLQEQAFSEIRAAVIKNNADDGVAVIMEPGTGNVLAMASYPTFDPTGGSIAAPPDARRSTNDPVVQDRLEPGSMFKILTLAKGLNDGKIDPTAKIDCEGQL
ncbi:MAG TPA: penicillin-binding transpeptidase domain-containing protein, partial [Fimbriimonadaceae bacterium]|nr:penicillin-binding transpeptidase domain-containing protein [Fimbriimonadaceae bacterium]